jgi:hypothetical protein
MSRRFRERWLAQAGAAQQRIEDGLNVGKIVLTT